MDHPLAIALYVVVFVFLLVRTFRASDKAGDRVWKVMMILFAVMVLAIGIGLCSNPPSSGGEWNGDRQYPR
jgi:hypothetical protein